MRAAEIQATVGRLGGIERLLTVLTRHETVASVVEQAFAALWNLGLDGTAGGRAPGGAGQLAGTRTRP